MGEFGGPCGDRTHDLRIKSQFMAIALRRCQIRTNDLWHDHFKHRLSLTRRTEFGGMQKSKYEHQQPYGQSMARLNREIGEYVFGPRITYLTLHRNVSLACFKPSIGLRRKLVPEKNHSAPKNPNPCPKPVE